MIASPTSIEIGSTCPRCAATRRPWPSGTDAPIQTCRPSRKPAPTREPIVTPPQITAASTATSASTVPGGRARHHAEHRGDDEADEGHHAAAGTAATRLGAEVGWRAEPRLSEVARSGFAKLTDADPLRNWIAYTTG
jgi:hypothetical protein